MKYNVVISRTYATELVVDANDKDGVYEWLAENQETINHQEMEQCNIISDDANIELIEPSENEAEELIDLVSHIRQRIYDYRHVEAYIPKEMWDALEKMSSHVTED
jgi:hypothetical protein